MDINEIRKRIDEVDGELLRLFGKRMELSELIALYKLEHSLPVENKAREDEIIARVTAEAGETGDYAAELFRKIFELSKRRQCELYHEKQKKYGLVGRHISYSRSPEIHSLLGLSGYSIVDIEPEQLDDFFSKRDFGGLNVTIPYKTEVIRFCDELSDEAREIGSVNTIVHRSDGTLLGCNTDAAGLEYAAERAGISFEGRKVVIFGSGGASKAAQYAAVKNEAREVVVISRSGENNYGNLDRHYDADVLINATPLGTTPDVDSSPADLTPFSRCTGVIDMVYNPMRTAFLMQAEKLGTPRINGLPMLVWQAKKAEELFFDTRIPAEIAERALEKLSRDMENIVLIGMPGCGKSTIGAIIGQLSGREVIDADAEIVKAAGMSVPEIFDREGESGFRGRESEVINAAGLRTGVIIVTGGGVVTQERNYAPLHRCGRIYHIERDLSKLPDEGRPLSQTNDMAEMYEKRLPMYRRFRDVEVCNDTTPEECAERIWHDFNVTSLLTPEQKKR